ncbi:MAG: agmatinase [Phycisphaeraceae bacterium]|nr:agmatinase [Phycisphaeraceae bacterium]MCW5753380.1 agmatinase [Phycisphaeraceae bacterium]
MDPITPRTILPDARVSPRFAGIATFGRYPRLEDVPPERSPVDWVIYGVPFDSGVTYRPGARFGPRAIRDASQYVKRFHVEHGIDLCSILSLADGGDSPVNPFDCEANAGVVHEFAAKLGKAPQTRLLALGGDHSIAFSNIRATWERQGKPQGGLPMIHFDSHVDTVDMTLGERWSHASPFRRAVEAGLLDPKRMLSIGIKGPLNTADDLAYARDNGVTLVTYEQLQREGTATIDRFLETLGETPVYLTFDIDVIDPAYAPGTGTPCPGGLTSGEAFALLRRMRGINVVGADVVEVLPDRDVAQNTALLAGHIAFEILALDAVRRVKNI